MATFTPGPWNLRMGKSTWDPALPDYPVAVVSAKGANVAFSCVTVTSPGIPEIDANTRLIAAAPELLEALKDCLGWHDFADDLHKPIEVRAAYMRARAAIAKAES